MTVPGSSRRAARARIALCFLTAVALATALAAAVPASSADPDVAAPPDTALIELFVSSFEEGLQRLDRAWFDAMWTTYTTGRQGRLSSCEAARATYLRNPLVLDEVSSWVGRIDDQRLGRRVELLHRVLLQARVEGIEAVYALEDSLTRLQISHRARLEGRQVEDAELARILRVEPDRARRRAAFIARAGIGEVLGEGLAGLFEIRTRTARDLGEKGFYELRLSLDEVVPSELTALMETLERETREPYAAYASDLAGNLHAPVEAWDLLYDPRGVLAELEPFFPADSLIPRTRRTFAGLGFDLASLAIHWDLEPREGKSEHAFCFPVDPPGDVRVLANARPGIDAAATLLHETGHAVHATALEDASHLLRDGPSGAFNEGIGELFGQLAYDPEWMAGVAGVPADLAARYLEIRRTRRLFTVRWYLALLDFEREAYARPGQDLSALYWAMLHRYLLVPEHPEIPVWAQVPHLLSHPVYVQNYLLADLVAAQMRADLTKRHGGLVGRRDTAGDLRERLFRHGALYAGQDLILRATGARLDPAFFARELLDD
jgi:peptidyl-dipeptidase A